MAGSLLGGLGGAQAAGDLEAVDAWHHHVEHQQIGRAVAERAQRAATPSGTTSTS